MLPGPPRNFVPQIFARTYLRGRPDFVIGRGQDPVSIFLDLLLWGRGLAYPGGLGLLLSPLRLPTSFHFDIPISGSMLGFLSS